MSGLPAGACRTAKKPCADAFTHCTTLVKSGGTPEGAQPEGAVVKQFLAGTPSGVFRKFFSVEKGCSVGVQGVFRTPVGGAGRHKIEHGGDMGSPLHHCHRVATCRGSGVGTRLTNKVEPGRLMFYGHGHSSMPIVEGLRMDDTGSINNVECQ